MVFDDIPQTIDCFDCKAEIQPTFNETFDLLEQNGLPTETRNGVESEMDRILEEIAELKTSLNTYTRSKLEAVDPRVPAPSTPAPSAPNQEQTNTLMAAFNGFVAALPTLIEQLKTEDSTDNSTQISENPRDNELVDSPSEPNTGNETTTDPNENDAPKDTEENNDDAEDNNDDENEDDAKRKERERKREAEQREKRKQQ